MLLGVDYRETRAEAKRPVGKLLQTPRQKVMVIGTEVVLVEVGRISWIFIYFEAEIDRVCQRLSYIY